MKIYISGPMEGVENYQEIFKRAADKLLGMGYSVVNPAALQSAMCGDGFSRKDFLRIDLDLLEECDAILLLDGWEESKGCNREYGYALGCGKVCLIGSHCLDSGKLVI